MRGRPKKENALSGAERVALHRQRKKDYIQSDKEACLLANYFTLRERPDLDFIDWDCCYIGMK